MSSTQSIASIVQILQEASTAYYNGGKSLLDDETFDSLVDTLRERDPSNSFLSTIGAPPSQDTALLPFLMPSLDKIKPGQPQLTKFLTAAPAYVFSEKLDGLSALWCPKRGHLYLRGDGRNGQTVSHLSKMGGLVPAVIGDVIVRGEILIPKSAVDPGQIARTIVNGLVHRKEVNHQNLTKLRFVAYEVLQPTGLTRSQQFTWLQNNGYETPWWKAFGAPPTEADCIAAFKERRAASPYDIDGIVVAIDQPSHHMGHSIKPTTAPVKNPRDCVAFKMPLQDQSAVTTVQEVIWAASNQGYLIPKLRFDPVSIGGSTIEFCTAHNARVIVEKCLGPGAIIQIRRSGDVIPTLDAVMIPAQQASMPPTDGWSWDGEESSATHIRATTATQEQVVAQLLHFAKTLEIPGCGPAAAKALVENGIKDIAALWAADTGCLSKILGPKTGATLFANLRTSFLKVTEQTLMIASSKMPRGVGESKLNALFEAIPDCRSWATTGATPPTGWTDTSFREFQKVFPAYEAWRLQQIHWLPYPVAKAVSVASVIPSRNHTVCFTGFRDPALEMTLQQRGFTLMQTVSSKLKTLVTADAAKPSEKVKKAQEAGTEILQRSEFIKKYIE